MITRIIKITFGIALLVLGIWAVLLPPFFPSSSYSVVNTRKVDIEAPINGTISQLDIKPRARISKGDPIALITLDQRSVEQDLRELEFTENRLVTQIKMAEERLESLRSSLREMEKFQLERKARIIAGLRIEQAGVEDSIQLLQKETRILKEDERRIKRLLEDGIITKARWSEVNRSTIESEARLQDAVNKRNRIAKELELAKSGLIENENSERNTPTPEVTIASTQYELRTVEGELSNLRLKHDETVRLIESAERYLSDSRERVVKSPIGGVVWNRYAVEGQSISTGQSIVQVASENSVYIEGYFHRYYEDSITAGDHAFIRLSGDHDNLHGRVVDIQVQEHGSSDLNIINSVAPSSSMLRVIIEVESIDLTPEMVGRLGKVVLTRDRPGILNQSLVWLSLRIRNT